MKKLLFALLLLPLSLLTQQKITLVIDPGHGGTDPGNLNSKTELNPEKDINLKIAKKLADYVDLFLGHEVKVILTRQTDEFIELTQRVEMANKANAHYFISIHCNASPNNEVCGTETHIHNMTSETSRLLAHEIEKQFKTRAGRNSRGVKQKSDRLGNLFVLRDTKMPAVLVETGFMTNENEEKYLNEERGQDLIASAIFRAFRDFIKTNHQIEMRTPPGKAKEPTTVWKIQIMASTGPVALDNPDFLTINQTIEEIKIDHPSSPFNFKYYVGKFTDKKDAKNLLKELKEGIYKDAFLVKFEE